MLLMRIVGFDREMNCGRIMKLIAHRRATMQRAHALLRKGSKGIQISRYLHRVSQAVEGSLDFRFVGTQ